MLNRWPQDEGQHGVDAGARHGWDGDSSLLGFVLVLLLVLTIFQVSLNQAQQLQPKQSSVVPSRTLQLQPIQHHTDLALVRLGDQDEAPVRLGNQTAYGPVRQKWSINSFSLSFCVANLFPSGTIWLRKIC